jgi:hypothetical protein
MDYLTYIIAVLLIIVLGYILYHVFLSKNHDDELEIKRQLYRELPGGDLN